MIRSKDNFFRKQIEKDISKDYTVKYTKMKYKKMLIKGYALDMLLLFLSNSNTLFFVSLTLGIILFILTLLIANEFKYIEEGINEVDK